MYNELLRKKESVLSLRRGVVQDLQKWNGRRTILKDGLVVDPENERKDQFDIVVEGDTISSVEKNVYIEKETGFWNVKVFKSGRVLLIVIYIWEIFLMSAQIQSSVQFRMG